ncbi:hypothetical protein V2J09_004734 [Rumex salicifolius]
MSTHTPPKHKKIRRSPDLGAAHFALILRLSGFCSMLALKSCLLGFRKRRGVMDCLVLLFLVLTLGVGTECSQEEAINNCNFKRSLNERPHSVSIVEFGAVGDGKTLNTVAFQNAIFYLKSFVDKGGAMLYVPPGRWLTGCFNLTSHLTIFLEKDAVILGSQDYSSWELVEPLPSYGRGLELPGKRYSSLISGIGLKDIVITGNNGTINGQGYAWWEFYSSHLLNYSRPHLLELINSTDIVILNVTFLNPPAWSIHTVYCNQVLIENVTVHAPLESPNTNGIVPDSSEHICIGYSNITAGYDAVVVKSGWDEYGIAYGKPTTNLQIRSTRLRSRSGAALAFGSEMSGGISNVTVKQLHLQDSYTGIEVRTSRGRGGYIEGLTISDVEMDDIYLAIKATGGYGSHPDERFDPNALPVVKSISFENIVGRNITISGNFTGIYESPFTSIFLSNVSFEVDSATGSWVCSDVFGFSAGVSPQPCPELMRPPGSSPYAFSILGVNKDTRVQ